MTGRNLEFHLISKLQCAPIIRLVLVIQPLPIFDMYCVDNISYSVYHKGVTLVLLFQAIVARVCLALDGDIFSFSVSCWAGHG